MSEVEVLLIRHAHAGSRGDGHDELRPLSAKGRRQAGGLAARYRDVRLCRTVTSPYVRCVETIVPLAAVAGTDVEEITELGEGHGPGAALALIEDATTADCTFTNQRARLKRTKSTVHSIDQAAS